MIPVEVENFTLAPFSEESCKVLEHLFLLAIWKPIGMTTMKIIAPFLLVLQGA
jgi:hypothetical protein